MRARAVFLAAVAALFPSFSVHAESAGAAALRAWVASIDASPKWTASFTDIDDRPGLVKLHGLSIHSEGNDEAAFGVGQIAIRGYRPLNDGGFAARRVALDTVTATVGPFTYGAAALTLKGVAFPALGVVIDPDHLFTSIAKAYTAASAIRIDSAHFASLRVQQSATAQKVDATYDNIWMSGLRNGKLKAISVGPIAGTGDDDNGKPVRFALAGVEAGAIDFSAVARFLDPDAYADGVGDSKWRTVVRSISYGALTVESADANVSVDRMLVRKMQVRQAPKPFAAAFDILLANPDLPESEAKELFADAGLDFFSGLALGQFSLRGVKIEGLDEEEKKATAAFKEFSVSDISLAGVGEMALTGLGVATSDGSAFSLDRFTLGGLAFPSVETIRLAMAIERAGGTPDPAMFVPELALLEVAGAALRVEDKPPGRLASARFDFARYIAGLPTGAGADVRHLIIPVALLPDEDTRTTFAKVGIDAIDLDFGYRADWLEDTQQIAVRDFRLALRDIGEAHLDFTVGGVTREMIANRNEDPEALAAATFDGATITVTDRSFTDKLIRHLAEKDGKTPEEYRKQVLAGLPILALAVAAVDPELGTQAAKALAAYLQNPGTLTVTVKPKQPVSLIQLMAMAKASPEVLPAMLAITIEATP